MSSNDAAAQDDMETWSAVLCPTEKKIYEDCFHGWYQVCLGKPSCRTPSTACAAQQFLAGETREYACADVLERYRQCYMVRPFERCVVDALNATCGGSTERRRAARRVSSSP